VYFNNPSIDNPDKVLPQRRTEVAEGELTLPEFYHTVKSLDQVVDVDYYIPGCPPEPHQIWAVLQVVVGALTAGQPLPPGGSIVGAGTTALCDECTREKREKAIKRFYRPYEIQPDPDQCLLEQGIICMGIATRSGCGALCPSVGIGCRGCYGPPDGVEDQGAKMLSAIASVLDVGDESMDEDVLEELIQEAVDTIPDPTGTFYRFSMAHSILTRVKNGKGAA
jgi:F420-non-reducing hydrogenase small subunit